MRTRFSQTRDVLECGQQLGALELLNGMNSAAEQQSFASCAPNA